MCGSRELDGMHEAAGKRDVILLDQDRVIEAEAVVDTPARCHRRLLQRPQPRGCLARIEDLGAAAAHTLNEACRQRRDAGEMAEQVERGAFTRK